MERTNSIFYDVDGIPVEQYECKKNDKWIMVIKYNEGITDLSILVFEKLKNNFKKFIYAEVECWDESENHCLMLRDEDDNEMYLSGCNSGYRGTGPHGTLKVLNMLGFIVNEQFVFNAKTFNLHLPSEI